MKAISIMVLLVIGATVNPIISRTYYVSNGGNDGQPGTLIAPLSTIQEGANRVLPGDTVFVLNGIYSGFDHRNTSGSPSDPIVFIAESTHTIIESSGPIRSDGINIENVDHIVVDGFTVRNIPEPGNGIRVVNADFCIVRNCFCTNNWNRGIFTGFTDDILIEYNECSYTVDEHGIYVSNSSDRPVIRFNISHHNNNIGIHMNGDISAGGDGVISDAEVYGNILYENNRAAGLNMDGVENALVYNNLIYNNHQAQGIALFQIDGARPSSGAKVYHNTIMVPDDGRWGILLKNESQQGTEIFNNIILNAHSFRGSIATDNLDGLTSDYNLLSDKMSAVGDGTSYALITWQNLGQDAHSMLAPDLDDLFVGASSNDYSLISQSAAVNSGNQTIIDTDINTDQRDDMPDIGAYEYSQALPIFLKEHLTSKVIGEKIQLHFVIAQMVDVQGIGLMKLSSTGWERLEKFNENTPLLKDVYIYDESPQQGMNHYRLVEITNGKYPHTISETKSYFESERGQKCWIDNSTNQLVIEGQNMSESRINIYNVYGQLIFHSKMESSRLNLPNIQTGIYFVVAEKVNQVNKCYKVILN